jgi:uncharacterized membrane protein YGL010W
MIGSLPVPEKIEEYISMFWVWVVLIPITFFYFRLNWKTGVVMIIFSLICLYIAAKVNAIGPTYLLYTSISIFIAGWVGQFIGHKIEGKKPSFFEDINFLLIGPLWVFRSVISNKNKVES